ncbi:MAG TPA: hypothetical protein VI670_00265 [Thermoanaerobaculia bacterium]|jgi:hypothetical protein
MPRLTFWNDQVRVYDDVLPREAFEALLSHATYDDYAIVHREQWHKSWRLGDGLPLYGTTTYYRPNASLYAPEEHPRYPTQTPLDAFIDVLKVIVAEAADLVGEPGASWTGITVGPWVYPLGSALSLHRNAGAHSGSYTYFIHRQWNFHWGGQLLVLDSRTGRGDDPDRSPLYPHWLSEQDENRAGMEPGLATCVLARPNRLVFVAPTAYQMITRVDTNAGNHPRVSLAGFFLRPNEEVRGDAADAVE